MKTVLELALYACTQFAKTDVFAFISCSMSLYLIVRLFRYLSTGKGGVL